MPKKEKINLNSLTEDEIVRILEISQETWEKIKKRGFKGKNGVKFSVLELIIFLSE